MMQVGPGPPGPTPPAWSPSRPAGGGGSRLRCRRRPCSARCAPPRCALPHPSAVGRVLCAAGPAEAVCGRAPPGPLGAGTLCMLWSALHGGPPCMGWHLRLHAGRQRRARVYAAPAHHTPLRLHASPSPHPAVHRVRQVAHRRLPAGAAGGRGQRVDLRHATVRRFACVRAGARLGCPRGALAARAPCSDRRRRPRCAPLCLRSAMRSTLPQRSIPCPCPRPCPPQPSLHELPDAAVAPRAAGRPLRLLRRRLPRLRRRGAGAPALAPARARALALAHVLRHAMHRLARRRG